jgi:uncharacterized OsmC-like protein
MKIRVHGAMHPRAEASARFHQVWCDVPFEDGGSEGGMRPEEMLLASIGCASMLQAREYLRGRRALPRALAMTVRTARNGAEAVEVEIDAPGLSPFLRAGVVRAIENSMLTQLFKHPPRVSIKTA